MVLVRTQSGHFVTFPSLRAVLWPICFVALGGPFRAFRTWGPSCLITLLLGLTLQLVVIICIGWSCLSIHLLALLSLAQLYLLRSCALRICNIWAITPFDRAVIFAFISLRCIRLGRCFPAALTARNLSVSRLLASSAGFLAPSEHFLLPWGSSVTPAILLGCLIFYRCCFAPGCLVPSSPFLLWRNTQQAHLLGSDRSPWL